MLLGNPYLTVSKTSALNCLLLLCSEVTPEMPCWREEIFGPVAAFRKFTTEAEALQEANSSDKGLAAFFFSR